MYKSMWVYYIFTVIISGLVLSSPVYFDFKNDTQLFGRLNNNFGSVLFPVKLKALTDRSFSSSGRICGFHIISDEAEHLPFNADLVDPQEGIGEIRVRPDAKIDFDKENNYQFDLEAYDCDNPPHSSKRILIHVTTERRRPILAFTKLEYEFSAIPFSPVGTVCDKVTISNAPIGYNLNSQIGCGYSIVSGDLVPFTVDSQGVIRTREVLYANSPRSFTFAVQYTDCSSSPVHSTQAKVQINVVQGHCEAAWQGLPTSVEYSPADNRPSRLFWPPSFTLNTCHNICPSTKLSVQLKIRSSNPEVPLAPASAANCRHDPASLEKQKILCGVDSSKSINLLPDSTVSIERQVTQTQFGNLPQLVPISLAFQFNPSLRTSWRVDTRSLLMAIRSQNYVQNTNMLLPELLPRNIFERDFTLRFWLQRRPRKLTRSATDEAYETILCSQEDSPNMVRALSVAFNECYIIIQLTTREGNTNQADHRSFRTLVFPELPETICLHGSPSDEQWHHYTISVSLDQATTEIISSNLMVDGIVVGSLEELNQPIVFTRPTHEQFHQIITVGSCYNPSTRQVEQVLDGALAGLSLVLGEQEDRGLSWCLAQCGEMLLLPNSNELLKSGGSVYLNVDSILVTADSVAQAVNILSNVAYSNPGHSNFNSIYPPERELEIHTNYTCNEYERIDISVARISLTMHPQSGYQDSVPTNGGDIVTAELPSESIWIPQAEVEIPKQMSPYKSDPLDSTSRIVNSPVLAIIGVNTISADVPVREPGLPMFPELKFVVSNLPTDHRTAQRVASSVLLDECLVIPISGGVLNLTAGERINWPVGRVNALGITGVSDKHGIRLNGHLRAAQYASLFHSFRYWPPIEITRRDEDSFFGNGVVWTPKFELVCSYDSMAENTEPFIVKIVIRSAELAEAARKAKLDASFGDSPVHRFENVDSFVEDDEDEDYDYEYGSDYQRDASALEEVVRDVENKIDSEAALNPQKLNPHPNYIDKVKPDKFVQPAASNPQLESVVRELKENKSPSLNMVGLSVTLSLCCFVVMLLVIIFFLRNRSFVQRFRLLRSDKNTKSGGRLQLRPESQLNVTENPIEKLEVGTCDWKSEYLRSRVENLPNVHVSSARDPSIEEENRRVSEEDQFDAETRSFDGLFEEDYIEGADLEEVDDFDESPFSNTQSNKVPNYRFQGNLAEVDEECVNDQDVEDIQNGINHLQFLTLPQTHLKSVQNMDASFANA